MLGVDSNFHGCAAGTDSGHDVRREASMHAVGALQGITAHLVLTEELR